MALSDYGTVYDSLKAKAGDELITAEDVRLALDQQAYEVTVSLARYKATPEDLDFLLRYLGLSDDIPLSKLGETFVRHADYLYVLESTANAHKTLAERRAEMIEENAAIRQQMQSDSLQSIVDRYRLPRDFTSGT
jgi:hypothetical protein